jgi:hypothetical protein
MMSVLPDKCIPAATTITLGAERSSSCDRTGCPGRGLFAVYGAELVPVPPTGATATHHFMGNAGSGLRGTGK